MPRTAQDRRAARLLKQTGIGLLALCLILYTAVIVAFSAWQADPLPIAWIRNLPEAVTQTWFAIPFWGGVIAFVAGWGIERVGRSR